MVLFLDLERSMSTFAGKTLFAKLRHNCSTVRFTLWSKCFILLFYNTSVAYLTFGKTPVHWKRNAVTHSFLWKKSNKSLKSLQMFRTLRKKTRLFWVFFFTWYKDYKFLKICFVFRYCYIYIIYIHFNNLCFVFEIQLKTKITPII